MGDAPPSNAARRSARAVRTDLVRQHHVGLVAQLPAPLHAAVLLRPTRGRTCTRPRLRPPHTREHTHTEQQSWRSESSCGCLTRPNSVLNTGLVTVGVCAVQPTNKTKHNAHNLEHRAHKHSRQEGARAKLPHAEQWCQRPQRRRATLHQRGKTVVAPHLSQLRATDTQALRRGSSATPTHKLERGWGRSDGLLTQKRRKASGLPAWVRLMGRRFLRDSDSLRQHDACVRAGAQAGRQAGRCRRRGGQGLSAAGMLGTGMVGLGERWWRAATAAVIGTEDEMNRIVRESQSLNRFLSCNYHRPSAGRTSRPTRLNSAAMAKLVRYEPSVITREPTCGVQPTHGQPRRRRRHARLSAAGSNDRCQDTAGNTAAAWQRQPHCGGLPAAQWCGPRWPPEP